MAFLVPSIFPNAVSAGLPNLTPNLVPCSQPSHSPSGVMSLSNNSPTSLDPGSFYPFVLTLDSGVEHFCAPGHNSSTVPNSFLSLDHSVSGSVPSVFHFDVPSGDSHWTTSFSSSSV